MIISCDPLADYLSRRQSSEHHRLSTANEAERRMLEMTHKLQEVFLFSLSLYLPEAVLVRHRCAESAERARRRSTRRSSGNCLNTRSRSGRSRPTSRCGTSAPSRRPRSATGSAPRRRVGLSFAAVARGYSCLFHPLTAL